MSEVLTLDIPDDLAAQAHQIAQDSRSSISDVVMSWIRTGADEANVESLSDDQLLVLCESLLPDSEQRQLSDLLSRQREGSLPAADRARLDQLLAIYRRGLVVKARALKEAMSRGIKPPLVNDAA